MKNSTREKLLGIVIIILIIGFAYYFITNRSLDKRKLEEKNQEIQEKVEAIEIKEAEIDKLMKKGIDLLDDAIRSKKRMLKGEVDLAIMREENAKLLGKIKSMPPDEVVSQTKQNLKCNEIWLKEEGILFSLVCAKKNLEILEGFDLIRMEYKQLEFNYRESKATINKLEQTVKTIFGVNLVQKGIIFDWKDISKKKDEKIIIITKAKTKSFWKGILIGTGAGVLIVVGLRIILGK